MVPKKAGGGMTPEEERAHEVWSQAYIVAQQLKRLPLKYGKVLSEPLWTTMLWTPKSDFNDPAIVILDEIFLDYRDLPRQLANMGITNRTTTARTSWGEMLAININDIDRDRLAKLASSPSGRHSTFTAADPPPYGLRSMVAGFLVSAANRISGHANEQVKPATGLFPRP